LGLNSEFLYRRAANHPAALLRPTAPKRGQIQPPEHLRTRQKPLPVLRQTLPDQRIIARPRHPAQPRRQNNLGEHRVCLCRMQRQKRQPHLKTSRHEANQKARLIWGQPRSCFLIGSDHCFFYTRWLMLNNLSFHSNNALREKSKVTPNRPRFVSVNSFQEFLKHRMDFLKQPKTTCQIHPFRLWL